jgi:8-oxo-dGTP pyrophosphatase MutT (NUDIX family)
MSVTKGKLITSFTWISAKKILSRDASIPVRQVYCWIFTKDKKLILVSKDGKKWQFPGGHPELGESTIETCKREVFEETGLKTDGMEQKLLFFGYYHVIEPNDTNTTLRNILQLRYLLKLNIKSSNLSLKPQEKDTEREEEKIKFIKAFSLDEAVLLISWLNKSEEYQRFKKIAKVK